MNKVHHDYLQWAEDRQGLDAGRALDQLAVELERSLDGYREQRSSWRRRYTRTSSATACSPSATAEHRAPDAAARRGAHHPGALPGRGRLRRRRPGGDQPLPVLVERGAARDAGARGRLDGRARRLPSSPPGRRRSPSRRRPLRCVTSPNARRSRTSPRSPARCRPGGPCGGRRPVRAFAASRHVQAAPSWSRAPRTRAACSPPARDRGPAARLGSGGSTSSQLSSTGSTLRFLPRPRSLAPKAARGPLRVGRRLGRASASPLSRSSAMRLTSASR